MTWAWLLRRPSGPAVMSPNVSRPNSMGVWQPGRSQKLKSKRGVAIQRRLASDSPVSRSGWADGQARAICQRVSGLLASGRSLQGLVGDLIGGKLFDLVESDRSVVHDSHPFVRQRRQQIGAEFAIT